MSVDILVLGTGRQPHDGKVGAGHDYDEMLDLENSMEYYIDICKDKRFIGIIIECLKKQADYV